MKSDLNPGDFSVIPQPTSEPLWVNYPAVANHINETTLYADIINHYSGSASYPDRMTTAHETTHMVNNDIRNKYGKGFAGGGFYVGNNNAYVVDSPNFRKRQVANFIPEQLRASRFTTYVTGQQSWDDNPIYLFDEWIAYVNGGSVAVEQVKNGTYRDGWTDAVMGMLEFTVYGSAVILATHQYDSGFFDKFPDFILYTNYVMIKSLEVFNEGRVMNEFKWDQQEKYISLIPASTDIYNVIKSSGANI
jgi:hypothetical protein